MRITMQKAESLTREQMREFLAASEELDFALARRTEIYDLVERTLRRQRYLELTKKDKGVVPRFCEAPKVTKHLLDVVVAGEHPASPSVAPVNRVLGTKPMESGIRIAVELGCSQQLVEVSALFNRHYVRIPGQ